MIETKTDTIGGKSYACTQFPARLGLKMKARVAKICGPLAIGMLGSGVSLQQVLDSDLDLAAIAGSLATLNPDEFANVAFDLLATTKCNNVDVQPEFDNTFAGDYGHLYQVLAFVLRTNYASLFTQGGIGGLTVGARKQAVTSPAPSAPN